MITIKDMAQMLGVSTTTVSNVIHGKEGEVSPATVKRVQELIEKYEYIPNINARNLANNRSKMIGLVMKASQNKYENFIKDPFGGELTGVIESCVHRMGYYTMLYISDNIHEIINSVSSWNMDGLLLMGISTADLKELQKKIHKPMVFIDSYFAEGADGYVNIGIQDFYGMRIVTEYVISQGHRRIAFVADNCEGTDRQRFMGYREALKEAGIPYKEQDFIMLHPDLDHDAAKTFSEVYRRYSDYTALVVASDWYAVQIINELQDRGVKVPEDISVTGFDDNNYSKIIRPKLTTVRQDVSQKGAAAVECLVKLIEGEKAEDHKTALPVSLIIRDSVKNIW